MVAGADFIVDSESGAHDALAARELAGILGAHAALARELAFAVGDDDFQPVLGAASASFTVSIILGRCRCGPCASI